MADRVLTILEVGVDYEAPSGLVRIKERLPNGRYLGSNGVVYFSDGAALDIADNRHDITRRATAGLKPRPAYQALAEAWASIDGRLHQYQTNEGGRRDGYLCEAEEMIQRLEARGFCLTPVADQGLKRQVITFLGTLAGVPDKASIDWAAHSAIYQRLVEAGWHQSKNQEPGDETHG